MFLMQSKETFRDNILRETKSCLMKNPTEEKKERRCDAQAEVGGSPYRRYLVVLSKPDHMLQKICLKH